MNTEFLVMAIPVLLATDAVPAAVLALGLALVGSWRRR